MSFDTLGLDGRILQALAEEGYAAPTPIQAQAIPAARDGRDLLGIAQTGTGKTAAFGLPLLHHLAHSKGRPPRGGCRALILSPTRELASQIADSLKGYGRHLGLSAIWLASSRVGDRMRARQPPRGGRPLEWAR